MNKKIIAIAVATVMAAPLAMADVKVSGRIGGHLTSTPKGGSHGVDATKSSRDFADNGTGRIQFDGTVGNGFARIAMDVRNMQGGLTSVPGREMMAGYKLGGGSSLAFGRMAGAAKNLEKDPYITTFLQVRNTWAEAVTAKQFGSSSFIGSLIQYKAKVGGAKLTVQFDPTDNSNTSANAGHYGLGISGKTSGITWWASYNNGKANGAGTATSANETNAKFGASMKMGTVKLTLNVTDSEATNKNKTTATTFWADFNLGGGLSADVGYAGNGDKGTWTRVAINKKLNKGTNIYAGAVNTTPKSGTADTVIGGGMIVKF